MEIRRLTAAAEAQQVQYLRKSASTYLSGQYDWKWIVAIVRHSGLGKREVLSILMPLKGQGWKSRSHALFIWLEQPE